MYLWRGSYAEGWGCHAQTNPGLVSEVRLPTRACTSTGSFILFHKFIRSRNEPLWTGTTGPPTPPFRLWCSGGLWMWIVKHFIMILFPVYMYTQKTKRNRNIRRHTLKYSCGIRLRIARRQFSCPMAFVGNIFKVQRTSVRFLSNAMHNLTGFQIPHRSRVTRHLSCLLFPSCNTLRYIYAFK